MSTAGPLVQINSLATVARYLSRSHLGPLPVDNPLIQWIQKSDCPQKQSFAAAEGPVSANRSPAPTSRVMSRRSQRSEVADLRPRPLTDKRDVGGVG